MRAARIDSEYLGQDRLGRQRYSQEDCYAKKQRDRSHGHIPSHATTEHSDGARSAHHQGASGARTTSGSRVSGPRSSRIRFRSSSVAAASTVMVSVFTTTP